MPSNVQITSMPTAQPLYTKSETRKLYQLTFVLVFKCLVVAVTRTVGTYYICNRQPLPPLRRQACLCAKRTMRSLVVWPTYCAQLLCSVEAVWAPSSCTPYFMPNKLRAGQAKFWVFTYSQGSSQM